MPSVHLDRYQQFIERLRKARERAGLSRAEVARRLGILQSYVSKYGQGERRADFVEAEAFARVCGLPLAYFETENLKPDKRTRRARRPT